MKRYIQNKYSRVLILVFLGLFSLTLYHSFTSYFLQLESYHKAEAEKILSIAQTLAHQIKANDVHLFENNNKLKLNSIHADDPVYMKYHHLFKDIKKSTHLQTDINAVTYDSAKHNFKNIFSSNYSSKQKNITTPKSLVNKYKEGGLIETNDDGHWIYGIAPIKDKSGNTISSILIHENLDYFIYEARLESIKSLTLSIALFVIVGFTIFLLIQSFLNREEKSERALKEYSNIIEEKNNQITSSIHYAEKIQKSILYPISSLRKKFNDLLLLNKPKDIVSGDFYWYGEVGDDKYIAVVDCTGHGVPGGFMSMICNSLLRETIFELNITSPSKILDKLDLLLGNIIQNDEEQLRDGMDLAICKINNKDCILEYAGAFRPLIKIKGDQLTEIKGDRKSIGQIQKPTNFDSFTNHTLDIEGGETIYLYSDGITDQLGGKNEKKYTSASFKSLLLETSHLELERQQEIIDNTLMNWRGKHIQTDDILLIGLKL